MGIRGLNQLMKRVCEINRVEYSVVVQISEFRGKKVAVDACLYAYEFKAKQNFEACLRDFVGTLLDNGVRPLFVFDGVAPDEKHDERVERAQRRATTRERLRRLEIDLDAYVTTGTISDELRQVERKVHRLAPVDFSERKVREYIDRMRSQIVNLTAQDFDDMKRILAELDVPIVQASGEGEFFCAALCRHSVVDAVMSRDTDALACLSPKIITKMDRKYFHVVVLENVLRGMRLSEKSFVDLAIMCGTDFNVNVPRIGPIKSYDLISKYGTIDKLPPEIDVSCLNYERVRSLFAFTDNPPPPLIFESGDDIFDEDTSEAMKNIDTENGDDKCWNV